MSSCSRRPKASLKRGESSLPVEDWQLRILMEWQQKQPPTHPNLKQRRLLATQTGLNLKWISSWFKKANGASKRKIGTAAKGARSGAPVVARTTHGPGSPKLTGVAEAIPPTSTGVLSSAAEDPSLFRQSDVGVNAVSESVRPSVPHKNYAATKELPGGGGGADLVLVSGFPVNLPTNHDHLVLCSSPHAARLVQVSESPSALLHFQRAVNPCEISLGYDLASSFRPQHVRSPGSLLSGSPPPSSCGSHSPHDPVQTRHFHTTLGISQPVVPAYPEYTAHDSRPASMCIHPDSSVPGLVASPSLPSLAPLPSIYWLLFDSDEHSISTLRGAPLSPPGESCGLGVATASQAAGSATPVSFLAKWEDILTLERSVRSSFIKNVLRARQAQSPEVALIEPGGLGASLTSSGHDAAYHWRVQPSGSNMEE